MTLLSNWHFMRVFRALIAIWALSEAWRTSEWMLAFAGGIFALQAIFDLGCCGSAGCTTDYARKAANRSDDVQYEEIK